MSQTSTHEDKEPFQAAPASFQFQDKVDNDDEDWKCGIGSFKPKKLQVFTKMSAFVGIYSLSGLTTSTLNIYIVSQLTTLEKQFGFTSAQAGFLMSCNDIGFLLTVLLASYVANKVHIPRTLCLSTIMYGFAGILCSIVYFVSKDHFSSPQQSVEGFNASGDSVSFLGHAQVCIENPANHSKGLNETTVCDVSKVFGIGLPNKYSSLAMGLIAAGMLLQGVAKSPRYPMVVSYIDSVNKTKTPMFIGVSIGVAIFGPAIAFGVGGVFSQRYLTLEDVDINPKHPAWLGAWWLGFLIFGCISFVFALPLMLFPRYMKKKADDLTPWKPKKKKARTGIKKSLKGFGQAVLRLLLNPVYCGILIGSCLTVLLFSGSTAFAPKYLEQQFFLPSWKANVLIGGLGIVFASLGTIIGGCLTTKLKLSPLNCIYLTFTLGLITTATMVMQYFVGCSNPDIVGFSGFRTGWSESINTTTSCGSTCLCDDTDYFPVCGSNGLNYFSPCHAGCLQGVKETFVNCSCIGVNATATPGLCETDCNNMVYVYMGVGVVLSFVAMISMMPSFIVTIRSVSEKDKSFSIGFSAFVTTLLGWFPGPVIYGKIVDTACILWKTSCDSSGSCAIYDIEDLRIKKSTYDICLRILALAIYVFVLIKARHKTDWSVEPTADANGDIAVLEGETMLPFDDAEMAKTPTDWKAEPIYRGDKKSELKSFIH